MTNSIHIDRVVGSGDESVYAYHFPSQYKHCAGYPIKIGSAIGDPISRILKSQSAMQEEPSLDLIIKCADSGMIERGIHSELSDYRVDDTFGREWFCVLPEDILSAWLKFIEPEILNLGQQLRYYRHARGLSQCDLARLSGTRQSTISQIECGSNVTSISTFNNIAVELGMELKMVPI